MSSEARKNKDETNNEILTNVKYICKSSALITESLQKGCDITQLSNGDIIVTEVKIVNVQYTWDAEKGKMIRLGNTANKK
ncbi:MAG: hypothetical protein K0Q51_1167 [Rickettsiaceae bacterium]|jgi:hypothetical protein|nr:hypothetical protein [Rickettsiaceae bacterium]